MKRKALIIDDDLDILMLLKYYFTNQGYEIKTINRVGSFDEMFNGYIPNVVILDVWLSGIDGRAVCRAIKANKNLEKIPVIMISAHALENECLEAGATAFLEKPFNIFKLGEAVTKSINQSL